VTRHLASKSTCPEVTVGSNLQNLSANATTDRRLHTQLKGPLGLNIGV
jgi:hypothetical protein